MNRTSLSLAFTAITALVAATFNPAAAQEEQQPTDTAPVDESIVRSSCSADNSQCNYVRLRINVATTTGNNTPAPVIIDTDGDGVPDMVDKCITLREVYNGVDDTDGCPDTLSSSGHKAFGLTAIAFGTTDAQLLLGGAYFEVHNFIPWATWAMLRGSGGIGGGRYDNDTYLTAGFDVAIMAPIGDHFRLGPGASGMWWINIDAIPEEVSVVRDLGLSLNADIVFGPRHSITLAPGVVWHGKVLADDTRKYSYKPSGLLSYRLAF